MDNAARAEVAPQAAKPELVFRAMWPSEALMMLVREQDALYRGVVRVDPHPTAVVITKRGEGASPLYRVEARAHARGERLGCAEHSSVEHAIRRAYTELLRSTVDATTAAPCACAA